jgi:hypothetical protein
MGGVPAFKQPIGVRTIVQMTGMERRRYNIDRFYVGNGGDRLDA